MDGLVDGVFIGEFHLADLGAIIEAHGAGKLHGAAGFILSHEVVTGYEGHVRQRVGQLLQLLKKIFVMDELSLQWMPHLDLHEGAGLELLRKGGDPRWLQPVAELDKEGITVCQTVDEAFGAALRGERFILLAEHDWKKSGGGTPGGGRDMSYLPLYRWAQTYGALDAVCAPDQVATHPGFVMPPELVEQYKLEAQMTLDQLKPPAAGSVVESIDLLLGDGPAKPALPKNMRRLEGVLDPATHYDDYYYGVDGKCILYPKPDGSWGQYRGTAHHWEGNKTIAKILATILKGEKSSTLLDIGCGAGDFVECAVNEGFDAWGVDISDAAHKHAKPLLRDRLRVADVTKDHLGDETWEIVTAFDFWEHVWNKDVYVLIDHLWGLLPKGGLHVAVICTRGATEGDYVFEPGVEVTPQNGWVLVSGHVNVRRWSWWARKFKQHGFKLRYDLMQLFQVFRAEDGGLRNVESWSARNFIVVEKV